MKRRDFLLRLCAFYGGLAGIQGSWGKVLSYRVQKGDTLSGISRAFGVSVARIKAANGLRNDLIKSGQILKIPVSTSKEDAATIAVANRVGKLRKWTTIVAHHSAIDRGNAEIYGRAHERRGMRNGLAYHFVIGNGVDSGDGEIEVGPRWKKQLAGGHVRKAAVNAVGIGICLVGNFEKRAPSEKQTQALEALVRELRESAVVGKAKLTTHKLVDPGHTLCPGKHFPLDRFLRA